MAMCTRSSVVNISRICPYHVGLVIGAVLEVMVMPDSLSSIFVQRNSPSMLMGVRRLIRGVFHASHANAATNGIEVWNDLDIGHHASVFVVEDVAVDDELSDVTVVVRAHQHLVVV